jgi:hypothetical protein
MTTRSEPRLGYVPHFDVTAVDGRRIRYDEIWQRRNLVLIIVSRQERQAGLRYASQLEARREQFDRADTAVVVTVDTVPKLSAPTALVADRWGEILYLETASGDRPGRFPDIDEMVSWVHFAEIQCPECPP